MRVVYLDFDLNGCRINCTVRDDLTISLSEFEALWVEIPVDGYHSILAMWNYLSTSYRKRNMFLDYLIVLSDPLKE